VGGGLHIQNKQQGNPNQHHTKNPGTNGSATLHKIKMGATYQSQKQWAKSKYAGDQVCIGYLFVMFISEHKSGFSMAFYNPHT